MAVFATSRPFGHGVRQMKYEKMLDECPEKIREMPKDELEGFLYMVEKFYIERCGELFEPCMKSLGATRELQMSDTGLWHEKYEQARAMAREMALEEALAS